MSITAIYNPSINELVKDFLESLKAEQSNPINCEALYRGITSCYYLSDDCEVCGLSEEAQQFYDEETDELNLGRWMLSQPTHIRERFIGQWFEFTEALNELGFDYDPDYLIIDTDFWNDLGEKVFQVLTEDCQMVDDGVYEIKNRWVEGLGGVFVDSYHYEPIDTASFDFGKVHDY